MTVRELVTNIVTVFGHSDKFVCVPNPKIVTNSRSKGTIKPDCAVVKKEDVLNGKIKYVKANGCIEINLDEVSVICIYECKAQTEGFCNNNLTIMKESHQRGIPYGVIVMETLNYVKDTKYEETVIGVKTEGDCRTDLINFLKESNTSVEFWFCGRGLSLTTFIRPFIDKLTMGDKNEEILKQVKELEEMQIKINEQLQKLKEKCGK